MLRLCSRFTSRCAVGCVAAWALASFQCLAADLVQQAGDLAGFVRLHRVGLGFSRDSFVGGMELRMTGAWSVLGPSVNIYLVPSINASILFANINCTRTR